MGAEARLENYKMDSISLSTKNLPKLEPKKMVIMNQQRSVQSEKKM